MSLSLGLGLALTRNKGVGGWTPAKLGASLYDMWDAEDASKLTLVGSAVSAWASSKNGYSATQAIGAARPAYSATSFNGRPGVSADGADDELTYAGVGVFPVAGAACEIWALVDQTALAADLTARAAFAYGGAATASRRYLQRTVSTGVNIAQLQIGNGTGAATVSGLGDFSGRHVLRGISGAAQAQLDQDGIAGTPAASAPAIGTTRTRIGAGTANTAANFFQGVINFVAVTAPLTTDQAAQMTAYLKARGGIA